MKIIIKSGPGYLVKIENNSNEMITDPLLATRFDPDEAEKNQELMESMGLSVELIQLRFARIKPMEIE